MTYVDINGAKRVYVYSDQFYNQIESPKELSVGSLIAHNIHKATMQMDNVKFWRVNRIDNKRLHLVPVKMEHITAVARYHM